MDRRTVVAPGLDSGARAGRYVAVIGTSTVLALLAGMTVTAAATATDLLDPGPVVRWGLPLAGAVLDLSAGLTVGALLMAAFVVPAASRAWPLVRGFAVAAAMTWTILGALRLVLDYSDIAGTPLDDPGLGQQLGLYLTQVERGQLLLSSVLATAITAILVLGLRGPVGAAVGLGGAAIALGCVAFTGHAAGAAFHELAVSSLWLHMLGLGMWVGGLVVLISILPVLGTHAAKRGATGPEVRVVVARYSELAGVGFALMAASGIGNGVIRLGGWSALATSYGSLLIAKTVLLVALGVAGWVHRQRIIGRLGVQGRAVFARLAAVEILIMGAATGLGVAMSVSPPPLPDAPPANPTPAELVTGAALPPAMTPTTLLTQVTPDILWAGIVGLALVSYLRGVSTLRRRGDHWPAHRVVLWVLGSVALLYVTCGGIAVYGRTIFSAHMIQHMALTMMAPVLLSFGAPITLLLRSVPARKDGSRGPREWALVLLETRWVRFFAHPIVAAMNFTGSIIVFYYTDLFGLALSTHLGHELMMVHFTAAGYLFAQALLGIDPVPVSLPYPLRLLLLLATMGFHAFFGVTLMASASVLEATYFSSLGTGRDLLADQAVGGAWAWGIGELPTVALAVFIAQAWARSDDRESRRRDRKADRDGDADRAVYNEMLSGLAKR